MRKIFLIILLTIILFSVAASVQAARTIVAYPDLPGVPDPTAGVPQFIKYIFVFSLGIVGIVGLIAIIIAAFKYVTSVGNPQKAAEAKDRIFAALLGILLLLGSYLILNTINPDLLKLKGDVVGEGITIEVPPEEGPQGCRLKMAAWDKRVIDNTESAVITFTLTMGCKDKTYPIQPWLFEEAPHLRQVGEGRDRICDGYFDTASVVLTEENEDPKFSWLFDFSKNYHLPNTKNCAGEWNSDPPPPILGISECFKEDADKTCNRLEDKPEIFYLEGEIQLKEDMPKQNVPRLSITVEDLDDNEVCCR